MACSAVSSSSHSASAEAGFGAPSPPPFFFRPMTDGARRGGCAEARRRLEGITFSDLVFTS
eukprot:30109-Pelagococcus_subviridis.AAC.6